MTETLYRTPEAPPYLPESGVVTGQCGVLVFVRDAFRWHHSEHVLMNYEFDAYYEQAEVEPERQFIKKALKILRKNNGGIHGWTGKFLSFARWLLRRGRDISMFSGIKIKR